MKSPACLLSFALLAVLGTASAQSISSVTGDGLNPSQGSLGTTLHIVGTGFGGPTALGKPKAFLTDPVTSKKFTLKIVTSSDTDITALVTKAAYGALDVNVQPKGAALLTAAAAFTVPQPQITGADATGTIGNTVTIGGSGLLGIVGLSKPKVQLFNAGTNKKYSLKVLTFSDTAITASISKAVAGTMQLQLIPKGGATLVAEPSFVVPLPNISLIAPTFGLANATISLTCDHVGNKKPKVKLGNKSCKVVTFSDTAVAFLMPKKLAKGAQTLQLINGVGTATQIGAVINQGDTPDTLTSVAMTGTFNKTKFVAGSTNDIINLFAISGFYTTGPSTLTLTGRFYDPITNSEISGVTAIVPFDPNTFTHPVAFVGTAGGKVEYQIKDPNADPFDLLAPPLGRWSSTDSDGSYTLTILSVDPPSNDGETMIRGAFTGSLGLVLGVGNGTDPYSVANGEFRVLVDLSP